MAEDKDKNENEFSSEEEEFDFGPDETDEFGDSDFGALTGGDADSDFGNLPPLSDFESSAGEEPDDSDDALPPLGEITGHDEGDEEGGLPSIDDIEVETPAPTGGNIRPAPPGFETPDPGAGGAGFQDMGADSDFSPETPEIGPGPDSDIDTPMFDSAFGGRQEFEGISDTSTPTQAMETPMFGSDGEPKGEEPGFDDGAFGGIDEGAFDQGTPIPDFSPDTGVPEQAPLTGGPAEPPKKRRKAAGGMGGGKAAGVIVAAAIIALIVGLLLRPYVSGFLPLPDPQQATIQNQNQQIQTLQQRVATLERVRPDDEPVDISPEEVDRLLARQAELSEENRELEQTREQLLGQIDDLNMQFAALEEDVEIRRDEAREVQDQLEALRNDTAIQRARQEGLNAEVARLTDQVGELEEADARRTATKEALLHNVGRLAVQVREGLALTPDRYNRATRLSAVEDLRSEVQNARWMTPDLVQRYTTLYLRELEIASSREHFFARLPVTDRYGTRTEKWAECLMNGNWSVYFRTLDGRNVGVYDEAGFREELPRDVRSQIEETVIAHRGEGFEEGIRQLAQRDAAIPQTNRLQRIFDSL